MALRALCQLCIHKLLACMGLQLLLLLLLLLQDVLYQQQQQ
jgi:hypothetical protein